MNWLERIERSLETIEDSLTENISMDTLAQQVYTSSFIFQKMFALLCGVTAGEYIRNRRLTCAGYELLETDISILDLALKYQYETGESFCRAFTRFHGITPSAARKQKVNLTVCKPVSLYKTLSGGMVLMNEINERGYVVKETGAVYYTMDMDKTIEWFKNHLGWYGQIEQRDEDGNGLYGCVNNIPLEIEALHIAPFTGIHLFRGESEKRTAGFMMVSGIEKLYEFVKKSGWYDISEVEKQSWGGKTCSVTTADGSTLTFFE